MGTGLIAAVLSRRCLQCGNSLQNRVLFTNATSSGGAFRSFSTLKASINFLHNKTRVLLPQLRSTLRKEFRRNAGGSSDKRASKNLKDVKLSDLKRIAVLTLPHKGRILAGLGFLTIGSALFLSLPRILGKLIDEMDETKPKKEQGEEDVLTRAAHFFKNNLFALAAVVFIGACAIAGRIYCMHTASQLIVNDLRTKVFKSILRQDMAFFDKNKVGEIISRLSSDAYVVGYSISSNLSEGCRAVFTFGGSVGLMLYTSPELTKLGCFVIPAIVFTLYKFGKLQTKFTMQMQDAVAGTNQLATERLSNVRTVRAFVAETKELEAYKRKIHEIWVVSRREGTAKAIMIGSFQLVGYGFLTSLLYYGSHLISQGLLTYGDLSAFMIYAILASSSVSNMQNFYTELMRGLGASTRLFELRDLKSTIPLTGGIVLNDLKKEIRFESVAFAYPERDAIFNDVTFRVPVASTTAIVGPSGCGKSTIAHLLLRLYTPTLGRIVVDNKDLRELDPSAWRRLIGTVSQEPVLFSATIKENILYGVEEGKVVTENELHEAAELSNCLEFIQKFPDGFETMVGEHGASMLSGGQRQRIAIARALIKKPRILILDEATSALDATSEFLVRKALDSLLDKSGQTVLIIAHRLSTIKHANQIIVLDKGTVAELGTFDQLMAIKDGIFYKLVEKQTFDWRDDNY